MSKFAAIAQLANRAKEVAEQCDLHARPGQPHCPWETVGRLRQITGDLVTQVNRELAFEQKEKFEREQYQAEFRQLAQSRRDNREYECGVSSPR